MRYELGGEGQMGNILLVGTASLCLIDKFWHIIIRLLLKLMELIQHTHTCYTEQAESGNSSIFDILRKQ